MKTGVPSSSETTPAVGEPERLALSEDDHFKKTVEHAVLGAVLQSADPTRRKVLTQLGAVALTALVADLFPIGRLVAFAAEAGGKPENKDLSIGFIPITCATPIIMAEPLGFYKKYGLMD